MSKMPNKPEFRKGHPRPKVSRVVKTSARYKCWMCGFITNEWPQWLEHGCKS